MRIFPRPIVVVSKCIEFEPVRYDGQMISSDFVKQLKDYVDFISVCPEVEIGLGIPREPLRLVKTGDSIRLMQPTTGFDYTQQMELFSKHFLGSLGEVDGFILKSKSPSSAIKDARVYPAKKDVAALTRGPGVFGKAVLEKFSDKAVEDEKRLFNERIRENFLTKLYTLADFRGVKKAGSGNALVEFQAKNKLLLTAYSQVQLHIMGRLVAERKSRLLSETLLEYEGHLSQALKRPPNVGSNYQGLYNKTSNPITFNVDNTLPATPSSTPVPEFSWLIIMPLLFASFSIVIATKFRKRANVQFTNILVNKHHRTL